MHKNRSLMLVAFTMPVECTKLVTNISKWLLTSQMRRRMFATNRFVTSACSGQSVTSRLRSITSLHMFVTINVSFNAYACHEVHIVAKFIWSRTYVPKSSRHEVTFHLPNQLSSTLTVSNIRHQHRSNPVYWTSIVICFHVENPKLL